MPHWENDSTFKIGNNPFVRWSGQSTPAKYQVEPLSRSEIQRREKEKAEKERREAESKRIQYAAEIVQMRKEAEAKIAHDLEQKGIKETARNAEIDRLLLDGAFLAGAKYALSTDDIQRRLPVSPEKSFWADGYKTTKIRSVFTLVGQDMSFLTCAVVAKRCKWLKYNSSGLAVYSFAPRPFDSVQKFTAVLESSSLGNILLRCNHMGDVVQIKHQDFVIVNIGGGSVLGQMRLSRKW